MEHILLRLTILFKKGFIFKSSFQKGLRPKVYKRLSSTIICKPLVIFIAVLLLAPHLFNLFSNLIYINYDSFGTCCISIMKIFQEIQRHSNQQMPSKLLVSRFMLVEEVFTNSEKARHHQQRSNIYILNLIRIIFNIFHKGNQLKTKL